MSNLSDFLTPYTAKAKLRYTASIIIFNRFLNAVYITPDSFAKAKLRYTASIIIFNRFFNAVYIISYNLETVNTNLIIILYKMLICFLYIITNNLCQNSENRIQCLYKHKIPKGRYI